MRLLKDFDYFLEKGIVRKQGVDKSRSEFLEKESKLSFDGLIERVELMGINKKNSNSVIKDCYDIILESIRSKMFLLGYSSTGHGAHEAEVAFSRKILERENDVQFLNKLRYFRNGMIYYGMIFDLEYAKDVVDFTKRIYLEITRA
ncbi:hypothetical protein KAS08_01570 [Candidatus Pacearchaeota archaeon]|nr:hypothetical protein [Candidatus Pacearchaeota archaeon]